MCHRRCRIQLAVTLLDPSGTEMALHCDADMVRAIRLPPQKQLPPRPPEAAGGRQKQPRASQRDANPAHRVWASASWPWLPAGPDGNFTKRAPTICLVAMLGCSAAYNFASNTSRRGFLRQLDHAAIFLMSAGTYTPFTTCRPHGVCAIGMTIAVWTGAVTGAVMKLICPHRVEQVFTIA